ncbi:glycoside hydrolase family 3 N-terminal domain-containing protein [Streptomyces curacoi]|uniref:beta-glucosidase n=1 Tax=Streptomyces curacoi TaxID=146536 RepID=A0A117NV02_9ACTN|nr:glycoside hydrolase family 3 N-terminal domain-containing protein [Streptomyces curacoi]KUM67934.1 glycosyl hydrolase [Streptomyces curacoi]
MRRTALLASAALLTTLLPLTAAAPASGAPASGADDPAPVPVDRFEGEVPFASPPAEGIFTWGSDNDDPPALRLTARDDAPEGEKVLSGTYDISGYGGFTHDFAFAEPAHDWSAHKGIRFWWDGRNNGRKIAFELKDGGADGEASELWTTSFTDDFTGWKQIELPFTDFTYRTDYQPVGGIDHILGLTETWGYAITLPVGVKGEFAMDDVELYGKADQSLKASLRTDSAVYPTGEGGTATARLTVATTGSAPLAEPVTVTYETAATGTADPGEDYTPVQGTVTFPAGTASGATREIRVPTREDRSAEPAETIPLKLTVTGAKPPAETPQVVVDAHGLPYLDSKLPVRKRVADLLSRMSLEEKAGQMTQAERGALTASGDIATYALGSLLSGGGSTPTPNTAEAWAKMIDGFQLRAQATRFQIPLIYGVDAVHGHNNLAGATIMPHNIGLGASRNPGLARQAGAVTAAETRATGIPWDFAPCLCVTRDDRWGRAYESFGEDPALVESMATVIQGLQGRPDGRDLDRADKVLATAKHFVGDGGTEYGSSTTGTYTIDQGVTKVTRRQLEAVHLAPYETAVERGVGTVMPSYSSLDLVGDGRGPVKMHARADMINGVLKDRMGFGGFVISDWQAIDQIPGDQASDVRTSVNAGLDMIMVPYAYKDFHATLVDEVRAGRIGERRIDDAVSRILTQKFRLGLFEKPYADTSRAAQIGSAEHRAVARRAAAESQVLLKIRPQLIDDERLAAIDALVASWLPGTEGDGVADVLYGKRPFTGQLPVTWPKSEAQLPINVGDAAYDPRFPYGWGLTTLTRVPEGGAATLKALGIAAAAAEKAGAREAGRALVTKARLIVQQRAGTMIAEAVAKPFAEADRLLLTGRYGAAVEKLSAAYQAA